MIDADTFLAHYGVRGMKWGVRKSSSVKSSTKRRVGTTVATVAGAAAGAVAGKKALQAGSKFLTSQKLNDKLVSKILKDQPKLVQKMARKKVSNILSKKANSLVSELTTSRNTAVVVAGTAVAGALIAGTATAATIHAIQNRKREKLEELDARA